jgi:hypothetical protein
MVLVVLAVLCKGLKVPRLVNGHVDCEWLTRSSDFMTNPQLSTKISRRTEDLHAAPRQDKREIRGL